MAPGYGDASSMSRGGSGDEPKWYPTADDEGRLVDLHESPAEVGMPELVASLVPSRQVLLHEERGRIHNALLRSARRYGLLAESDHLVRRLLNPRGNPPETRCWECLEAARQMLYEATMWRTAREQMLWLVKHPRYPFLSEGFRHRALVALRSDVEPEAFSSEDVVRLLRSDDPVTRELALLHLVPLLGASSDDS